jgi:hypothetical protein
MRNLIKKNLNGRKVLLLFILTSIVYAFMLIVTIPQVMNFAGGMKILDMMPTGYNPEYVNTLLKALGEQGRYAYLFHQIPLDMIYPSLFGVSYCLVLAYFLNRLGKLETSYFYLCLLPLFAGLFDYFENIGVITILNSFPHNSVFLSQTTNLFSVLKSAFSSVYFVILITTIFVFGINKIFQKAK